MIFLSNESIYYPRYNGSDPIIPVTAGKMDGRQFVRRYRHETQFFF